jgi:hypothetical protein
MKIIIFVILLYTSLAHAQIIIEQRVIEVPRIQNFVVNPFPASHWDSKRAPESQQLRVISVPRYQIVPTVPVTQPLPGQTEEQRRQMNQLIK